MKFLRHITVLMACLMLSTAGHAVQIRRAPGYTVPEYILPTDRDNPALWNGNRISYLTRAAAPGDYATKNIPRTDTIYYPLVLVDFTDLRFTIKDTASLLTQYNRMFNEHGYSDNNRYVREDAIYYGATGSVSDYFNSQSYGLYTPQFVIIGPVHPSQGYAYYGKGMDTNVRQMVREICDSLYANGLMDLAGFARNGNLDQFSIIYAGRGENYPGSDPNTIWPQADILDYNSKGIGSIKYACSCELFWDSDSILDGIGVFCHEFSHTLGLPDFYNTSSERESQNNAAMGYWSIMDYGNYENGGFSPVGYTAFEKYSLGWLKPEEITYAGYYTLSDISIKPNPDAGTHSAYRLSTGDDDQFILLENHTGRGWYRFHPTVGLMVTAIDYDRDDWAGNKPNVTKAKRYRILPADNNYRRDTNYGDLFPYNGTDSITTTGNPQLKAGNSYPPYSIYNIKRESGLITFYAGPDLPSIVSGHKEPEITINVTDGQLLVDAPAGTLLSVHDISGKRVIETVITVKSQQIPLPESGIWIVKCGNITRKVRL